MSENQTETAPEVEADGGEQAPEQAQASPDDEPRFTQRQVNALIASEKRKLRRERAKEQTPTAAAPDTKAQAPAIDDRLRELDTRLARIDFREWAAERQLNADQRRFLERIVDVTDSATWGHALEAESSILERLASEAPPRQAPKQPLTADSPGSVRVKDSLQQLTAQDVNRMSSKELSDLWAKEIRGSGGNGLFVAPNKRSK